MRFRVRVRVRGLVLGPGAFRGAPDLKNTRFSVNSKDYEV